MIESKDPDRWMMGVLFHPERTCNDERMSDLSSGSIKLIDSFVEQCIQYKNDKINY